MDEHSEDSIVDAGYFDSLQIDNASPEDLRRTVRFLHHEYTKVVGELTSKNIQIEQLRRLGQLEASNFQIVNHGFEVNSEINRIRTEYTEKMKEMASIHEQELRQMRDQYEQSLREIESEIKGQSHQHLIDQLEDKCMDFIEQIKKLEAKQQDLEKIRQELELERRQDKVNLDGLQAEKKQLGDAVSALKNDQVLKNAQIATLQSQLQSERIRFEHDRSRLREEQERMINERVSQEQQRFRRQQQRILQQEQRQKADLDKQKGKLTSTVEQSARLKNQVQQMRNKLSQLERLNDLQREKLSFATEELDRQKNINDTYRQFADKKQSQSKRLAQQIKKVNEQNNRLKQLKNNSNESQERQVERLNTRLKGLTDQLQQQRQSVETRYAHLTKTKVQQVTKMKQLEMDQLRVEFDVKIRQIKRLQSKISEVEMLNKCNINLLNQKNSLCEKQLQEINRKSKDIRQLQNQVADLREKDQVIDKINQELRDKDKTIVALESQIRESIKKSERVTEELRSKDRKVAALEQQVEDITRNLERMNGEIAAKDRLTGRYEQSNKDIDKNLAVMAEEIRAKGQIIAKYELQIRQQNLNTERLTQEGLKKDRQIALLHQQVTDINSKIADKSKSLQELTSLNATIETRERETKDALERTKRELERVSSRLKDVETSHKQQQDRIAQLEGEFKMTHRSSNEQQQKLQTSLQDYQSKIRESQAKQNLLRDEFNKAKQKIKLLQKDKASAEKVQQYKELLQSTTSLNESINEQLRKSHRKIAQLEQQLSEEREKIRVRNDPLEMKLRQAEKDVVTLQGELSQNKLHIGNLMNEKRFLEIKLQEYKKDRDNISNTSKTKLERYQEQIRQKQQHFNTDKAYLNEELTKNRQTLEELSTKHTQTKLQNQMLKGELENVTKSLAAAIEEQRSRIIQNESLKKRLKITEDQYSRLASSPKSLQKQESLAERMNLIQKLTEDKNEVNRLKIQGERYVEDKHIQTARLKNQLDKLSEDRLTDTNRLKQQLEKVAQEASSEQLRLRHQLKTVSQQAQEIARELERVRKEADYTKKQLLNSQFELSTLKQNELKRSNVMPETERLRSQLLAMTRQQADTKRQLVVANEKIQQLKREKRDLQKLLNEAEQTIQQEASKSKRIFNSIKQQKDDFSKANYERIQEQYQLIKASSKQQIERLGKQVQNLHDRSLEDRRQYEQKIAKLREDGEAHHNEMSMRHESQLKKQREERVRLKDEINKLTLEKSKLTEQLHHLQEYNSKLTRDIELKSDKIANLQAHIEKTGTQLNSQSSTQLLLKQQIKKLQLEIADKSKLISKIADLQNRCRVLNQTKVQNEDKLLELQGHLTEANNNLNKTKKQLNSLQKAYDSKVQQFNSTQQILFQIRNRQPGRELVKSRQQQELHGVFNQVERLNNMLFEKERQISDLKTMKTAKLERKRSHERMPSQLMTHAMQPLKAVRFEVPSRDVARNADLCWQDIQGRIQAVKQQNQRLKSYVGASYHPQS